MIFSRYSELADYQKKSFGLTSIGTQGDLTHTLLNGSVAPMVLYVDKEYTMELQELSDSEFGRITHQIMDLFSSGDHILEIPYADIPEYRSRTVPVRPDNAGHISGGLEPTSIRLTIPSLSSVQFNKTGNTWSITIQGRYRVVSESV
jgi:hypothetical protein